MCVGTKKAVQAFWTSSISEHPLPIAREHMLSALQLWF